MGQPSENRANHADPLRIAENYCETARKFDSLAYTVVKY
jgi:hypothetical protein